MFGLMKGTGCTPTETQKNDYRLHYCGTCKTIGKSYGQSARLLLNFDVVFLAELLSSLNGEHPDNWSKAYQSYNCFQLPDSGEEIPFPLQYAAAANILLAELKMDDNQRDGAKWLWKGIRSLFSGSFRRAARRLKRWGVEKEKCLNWVDLQSVREGAASSGKAEVYSDQLMEYLAEPTGLMTGYVFERGASLMSDRRSSAVMYDLGMAFGEMMYWVDAWEDFDKDLQNQEFNAIRVAYPGREISSDEELKNSFLSKIHFHEQKISGYLTVLPIPEEKKQLFISRLALNLSTRLYPQPHTCKTSVAMHPTTGISAASVPQLFRQIGQGINISLEYVSPMNLKKFSLTYAAFTGMVFASQLSAASRITNTVQEVHTFANLGGWAVGGFLAFAGMGYLAKRSLEIYHEEKAKETDPEKKTDPNEKKKNNAGIIIALAVAGVLVTIGTFFLLRPRGGGGCCQCNPNCDCDCS